MIRTRGRTSFADVNEYNDGCRFVLFYGCRRQTSNDVLVVVIIITGGHLFQLFTLGVCEHRSVIASYKLIYFINSSRWDYNCDMKAAIVAIWLFYRHLQI